MNTDELGRLDKYKANLYVENDKVFSYRTHVANIDHANQVVRKLGHWSSTTSKHTNYVASELGYETRMSRKETQNGV